MSSPGARSPDSRSGTASLVPLFGVFVTGLIIYYASYYDLFPVRQYLTNYYIRLAFDATFVTLPLLVYTLLYCEFIAPSGKLAKALQRVAVIAIAALAALPAIGAGFILMFVTIRFGAPVFMLLLPPFLGALYGGFLAFLSGRALSLGGPLRLRAHMGGGAIVGACVVLFYILPASQAAVDAMMDPEALERRPSLEGAIWSAFVLTLCYLPHLLATRPWLRNRYEPGEH